MPWGAHHPAPTCRPVSRGRFQSHSLPAIHGPLTCGPFTYPHSDAQASRASRPLCAQQTAAVQTPFLWPGRERTLVWPEAVEMAEWRRLAACGHLNCARTSISLWSPEIRPRAAGVPLHGLGGIPQIPLPGHPWACLHCPVLDKAPGAWCVPPCPALTGCSRSTSQTNYLHSAPAQLCVGEAQRTPRLPWAPMKASCLKSPGFAPTLWLKKRLPPAKGRRGQAASQSPDHPWPYTPTWG